MALSWLIPFAWNYLQFVLPLTRAYGVGWDDRADHMVMMPLLSSNPNSKSFDMCTAVSLCATNIDIARFTGTNMISGLDLRGVTLAQAKTWMTDTWKNNRDSDNQAFMYKSQSGPGLPEGVFMSDGGELSVGNMMDNLDCTETNFPNVHAQDGVLCQPHACHSLTRLCADVQFSWAFLLGHRLV